METYRTAKGFKDKTDAQILARGRKVAHDLTANPNFPTPVPAVLDLTTALDEYEVSISNASFGGTHLIAIRKEKRAIVIGILQRLGIYVDLNGLDSEAILLTSGFELYTTDTGEAEESEKPIILSGKDGSHIGEAKIRSKKMANAIQNQIRFAPDPLLPETTWTELPPQTKATFYLTGLTPGKLYWFQTRTYSTKGYSEWSDPFQFRVR
ncbi:MAG: fibronectin type III domain-containing protein [Sphingobacteriales bacterium]|nr:MAG: fibronectin type III domain-containing protein [Sphingobacteriales bacterium]